MISVTKKYTIKSATHSDLEKITECYLNVFPESIFSILGDNFVKSTLKWFINHPYKLLLFIEEEHTGKCLGFCGGHLINKSDESATMGMIRFGFYSAIITFLKKPRLVFHHKVISRYPLLFSLFTINSRKNSKDNSPESIVGLVVIGVLSEYRNNGLGKALHDEFEVKHKSMGALAIQLAVKKDNSEAISFYLKENYSIFEEKNSSFIMKKYL